MKSLSLILAFVMLALGASSYAAYLHTVETFHALLASHPTEANGYMAGVIDDALAQEALRYHDEGKDENSGPLQGSMAAHPDFSLAAVKLRFESFYQENSNKLLRDAPAALVIRTVVREYCGMK